jgi:hypothetical protein
VEASANPRHSPTLALLRESEPETVITVITKVDKVLDNEWHDDTNKLSPLSEHFARIDEDSISLRNFPHSDFQQMANEELAWFCKHMSAEEKKNFPAVGIRALLQRVSDVADSFSRPAWKKVCEEKEKAVLAQVRQELNALGPLQSATAITTIVLSQLFPGGDNVSAFLGAIFDENITAPKPPHVWQPDGEKFLETVRTRGAHQINVIFAKPELKLARYDAFRNAFLTWFNENFSLTAKYKNQWSKYEEHLELCRDVEEKFDVASWRRAAVQCVLKTCSPVLPGETFPAAILRLTADFPTCENHAVATQREVLSKRVQAMNEVIALL